VSVARPYARALLAAARDAGETEAVLADLEAAAAVLQSDADLAAFLNHPGVANEPKRQLLREAFGPRVRPLTLRFLLLLLDKRRFGAFPEILRAYRGLVQEALGLGQGRVETARPLTEAELSALEEAASRWAGRRVRLVPDVRPELIGGARIVLGDRVIDGSMAGALQRLARQLKG
jgi:F-type H+-transporting ATPase subunit delta